MTECTPLDPRTRLLLEALIVPTLLRLGMPNVLVMMAQATAGLIETFFVGKPGTDALAGITNDSGTSRGRRRVQGGRFEIRRVLYMAALTLYASFALRAAGVMCGDFALRRDGGMANAGALLVFIATMVTGVVRGRRQKGERATEISNFRNGN